MSTIYALCCAWYADAVAKVSKVWWKAACRSLPELNYVTTRCVRVTE